MTQERLEGALSFLITKPLAWTIYGLWLAVKFGWLGLVWCVIWLRDKWSAWWAKSTNSDAPVIRTELPITAPTKRVNKREVARKA